MSLRQGAIRIAVFVSISFATLTPCSTTGSARASGAPSLLGADGPLQPPAAALQAAGTPSDGSRDMGLLPMPRFTAPRLGTAPTLGITPTLPLTVDLSQYDPPVGNQGPVGSCASWAIGYYLRGWYAIRDGYYPPAGSGRPAGYAPMYLYTQVNGGSDSGSTLEGNLTVEQQQGIDARSDYTQGDYDWSEQPTAAETANAATWKIASWDASYNHGGSLQEWIETSIASGNPVVIAIPVYDNFYNATSTTYYIDGTPGTYHGGHAIFAGKYDANGLWIENQWGTGWGLNGWAELSWNFVNNVAYDAVSEVPITPTAPQTATPTPVPPTATATSTPVPPTATGTATPVPPIATNTLAPPAATNIPVPPAATNIPVPPTATAYSTAAPIPPTATRTPAPIAPAATGTVAAPPNATSKASPAFATVTASPPAGTPTPVKPAPHRKRTPPHNRPHGHVRPHTGAPRHGHPRSQAGTTHHGRRQPHAGMPHRGGRTATRRHNRT